MLMNIASFFNPSDGLVVPAMLDLGATFYVHFDRSYIDALGTPSSSPAATCKSADVATAEQDVSVLTVGGVDYQVKGIEPDGLGVTILRLSEA